MRNQLLPELLRDAAPFLGLTSRTKLALLDDKAQTEAYQRGARKEDGRQKEQYLSPVQL